MYVFKKNIQQFKLKHFNNSSYNWPLFDLHYTHVKEIEEILMGWNKVQKIVLVIINLSRSRNIQIIHFILVCCSILYISCAKVRVVVTVKCLFLTEHSTYFRHNFQIILVISGPYSKPWKSQIHHKGRNDFGGREIDD